jgi:hypothetical protein
VAAAEEEEDDGVDDYDQEERQLMAKDKDLGRLMGNEKAVLNEIRQNN